MTRDSIKPTVKDTITIIKTSAETNGRLTELGLTLMPGGGVPLHYHKTFAESFTIVQGELALELEGKKMRLRAGSSCIIPPYQRHRFSNQSDKETRFIVRVEPAHQGFEQSLRIGYGLASDGLSNIHWIPKDIRHTAVMRYLGDINIAGPLSLLSPLLQWIGKRARKSGLEKLLIEKYCR